MDQQKESWFRRQTWLSWNRSHECSKDRPLSTSSPFFSRHLGSKRLRIDQLLIRLDSVTGWLPRAHLLSCQRCPLSHLLLLKPTIPSTNLSKWCISLASKIISIGRQHPGGSSDLTTLPCKSKVLTISACSSRCSSACHSTRKYTIRTDSNSSSKSAINTAQIRSTTSPQLLGATMRGQRPQSQYKLSWLELLNLTDKASLRSRSFANFWPSLRATRCTMATNRIRLNFSKCSNNNSRSRRKNRKSKRTKRDARWQRGWAHGHATLMSRYSPFSANASKRSITATKEMRLVAL